MSNQTMFDATDISNIPASPWAVAGYIDGHWPTAAALKEKFPGAKQLTITVFGGNAMCADDESGDMTDAQMPIWVRQQQPLIRIPMIYRSVSYIDYLMNVLAGAGISRSQVRLWSAHYTGLAHICGPSTCRATSYDCDGTQWTDQYAGKSLDASLIGPSFFDLTQPPPPPPADWTKVMLADMPQLWVGKTDHPQWRFVHRLQGLCCALGETISIDGIFGPATQAAVERAQAQFDLTRTGIVNVPSWNCLAAGSRTPGNMPLLQLTTPYITDPPAHRFVHRLQGLCCALGVPVTIDGVFGPATKLAVEAVQQQFGIGQDGIAGPQTWGCLVAGHPA